MCDPSDKNNNPNQNGSDSVNGLKHRNTTEKTTNGLAHPPVDANFKPKLRWPDLMAQLFLHGGALYGLLFQFYTIKFYTIIWCKYHKAGRISTFRLYDILGERISKNIQKYPKNIQIK